MNWKVGSACAALSAVVGALLIAGAYAHDNRHDDDDDHGKGSKGPIVLERMGSVYAGGSVITAPGTFDPTVPNPFGTPAGQMLHVDHVYAQYKIPSGSKKKMPLVMWHGCLSPSWEITPDGREGYESIFVRRGWQTYVLDWPRTGRSGKSSVGATINPAFSENAAWNSWRLGIWPNFFPGSQFPNDAASLDQFFRQGGTNNGPGNNAVATDAIAALFNKIGPSILITHSASGAPGFLTAIKSANVKAVVAYEPNEGVYPTGEVPAPMPNAAGALMSFTEVSPADFNKLTKIPIQVIFSDYIPTTPDASNVARDNWRVRMAGAKIFVDLINAHGGDAQFIHLPAIGIRGNSHFAFTDKNNVKIADLLSDWLRRKRLDKEKGR